MNKLLSVLGFLFAIITLPIISIAQIDNSPSTITIDSIVNNTLTDNDIPGISLGMVRDGHIYYFKGYGSKNIETGEPIDSFTNFLTCSISKLFTATAIMQLVEQGKINISDKLTKYIPEFSLKGEDYKYITIRQMLTHTSGLPNIGNKHFIHPENDSLALSTFAHKLSKKKLSFKPGVQLNAKTYSNTAYDILGLVIERVTHQTYSQYVTNHVLLPAHMDSSSFYYQQINTYRRSSPHKKNWLTRHIRVSNYYPDIPQDKPCGNLNSNAYDLCQWMIQNLAIYNKPSQQNGLLKPATLANMWTKQETIPGYNTSIGLGWWIVESKKLGPYVFHVGNDPGYSATLIIVPKNNFGLVLLCNAEYPKEINWNKLAINLLDYCLLGVNK